MRRVTLIGRVTLAATAVLTLAAMGSAAEARARGFRLRLGVGSAAAGTPAPVAPRPPERSAAAAVPLLLPVALSSAVSARPSELRAAPREGSPPVPGAPAPAGAKAVPPPVRVAGPWCAPDRIVGAGAGFCEVN